MYHSTKRNVSCRREARTQYQLRIFGKRRAVIGDGGETRSPDIKINSEITTTKVATSVEQ